MLIKSSFKIICYPGIQGTVGAFDDVKEIGHYLYILAPRQTQDKHPSTLSLRSLARGRSASLGIPRSSNLWFWFLYKEGIYTERVSEANESRYSPGWTRTNNNLINSQVLYRLSYRGMTIFPNACPLSPERAPLQRGINSASRGARGEYSQIKL